MSNTRAGRRYRWRRRRLDDLYRDGAVLVASTEQTGSSLLQTVSVRRNAEGGAHVHVEHYQAANWDRTVDETDRDVVDLQEALEWLASAWGVHWSQLEVPGASA